MEITHQTGDDHEANSASQELVREIDISGQARALRFLRATDYALVILCGSMLFGVASGLITNPPLDDYPLLIFTLIMVAVFSLSLYTGLRHVGVIDASLWQAHVVAFPTLLFLCVSFVARVLIEISQLDTPGVPFDVGAFLGILNFLWIAAAALIGFVSVLLLRRMRIEVLGIRLTELLSQLGSQKGIRALSVASVKRVNAPYGILLGSVGAAILLGLILFPLPKDAKNAQPLLYFLRWATLLAFFLLIRARRYFQVSADSLLAVDKRRPILFLRAFDDDEKQQFAGSDKAFLDFSLELRLANHFTYFGPFIAIGSPKESVPQPGAARAILSEQEWQPRVTNWMRASSLIIMYSGKTHWVNWELSKIIEAERVPNLILMTPEFKGWSYRKRTRDLSTRIDRMREAFKETKWSRSLAAFEDFQHARAMVFDGDGSLVVIRSGPRNRDAYHLAALIAHYIILDRTAKPEVAQLSEAQHSEPTTG
jgi:hypothetical protein